jgi:hypothetical protein
MWKSNVALLAALLAWSPAFAQQNEAQQTEAQQTRVQQTEALHIAIVHRDSPAGKRVVTGINEAIADYKQNNNGRPIVTRVFTYPYEEAGLRSFREVVESEDWRADVVLGPSDTGVFLDLEEFADDLERERILVLSPTVTASAGNDRNGWLFRANVAVDARASPMYDYLARRGFNSIAVVYEASGFGDNAERAFRELLDPNQKASYMPLRYRNEEEIRHLATRIEAERPSAVGLFGKTRDIEVLRRKLSDVKHGLIPYRPQLFTLVDGSALCEQGVLFLSLSRQSPAECEKVPEEQRNEVTDLGYDTATLVLRTAADVRGNPETMQWREAFRERLVARMSQPEQALPRTGMRFSSMQNRADPVIRTFNGNRIEQVENTELNWQGWIESRLEVRSRRFGLMPLINLGLIIGIVAAISFMDVRRSHTGGWWRFVWRWTFIKLAFFNVLTAVSVFVFLCEVQGVRWDSWGTALTVAFGYTMLLKATLFETNAGQAVGFADFYARVLDNIRRKLMVLRYELEGPRLYFLAYTNSQSWLKQVLWRVYKESEDPQRAKELMDKANGDAEGAETEIGKRRVYARYLLDLMNWRQIVHSRLVPIDMKEYEIFDPSTLLREAAEFSTNVRSENRDRIRDRVEEQLERFRERDPKQHHEYSEKLNADLAESTSETGRTRHRLEWLVVNQVISIDQLWELGFLPADYLPPLPRSARWRMRLDRRSQWRPRLQSQSDNRFIEHRRLWRAAATGSAQLTIAESEENAGQTPWHAALVNCSEDGLQVLIDADTTPLPDARERLTVLVEDGELEGLSATAEVREAKPEDGHLRLCLQWSEPSVSFTEKICEYIDESNNQAAA